MLKNKKKKIVNKLSTMINNYKQLSALCNECFNDIDLVINKINEVIKYAFIKNNFINDSESLYELIIQLENIKDIDIKYQEYLNKNKFFSFGKNITNKYFSFPLDKDIKLADIKGIRLPSIEELNEMCIENAKTKRLEEEKKKKLEKYYKEQRVFDEIGLEYTRPELITIDSSFIYSGYGLSGDIYKDFRLMYNDERNKNNKSSPINRDYYTNIKEIKNNTDISIQKTGNVNEIKNGRHRIMYILENGKNVTIPVKITKRIEDREFNIILNELKAKYNIYVYKNNLLNDEPNVLLYLDKRLYEIKDKNELITFYNNLIKGNDNTFFPSIPFSIVNNINSNKIIYKYKEMIYNKYLIIGEKVLTSNFTESLKYFSGEANSLFLKAFNMMQSSYQSSIIYNYDFNKVFENNNNIYDVFDESYHKNKKTL